MSDDAHRGGGGGCVLARISGGTRAETEEDPAGAATGIGGDSVLPDADDRPSGLVGAGGVPAVVPEVRGEL